MTAQVVTNTLTLPNGDAAAGARVTVSLVASTTGHGEGFTSTVGIAYETTAVADSSGVWSVSLTPNSLITPADTVYKVVEQFGQTRVVNTISVPASGTPHKLGAILSDAPASIASAALSTHMVDATAAHAASAVAFTPTGSIAASTVQAAVEEVVSDASATFVALLPSTGTYTYDATGNVLTETVAGVVTTFTYDSNGNIATAVRDGVTRTFTYDASSNLTAVS